MIKTLPESWDAVLSDEFKQPYFQALEAFVDGECRSEQVFPPEDEVFNAFHYTPLNEVRVFLLGQDPYHDDGQAHGLCFSVRDGVRFPPSLRNIFKEMVDDLGCPVPDSGYLEQWARQGVLMLNAVLTVRAHEAGSHSKKGWETFTDAVIRKVNDQDKPVIFVLWGNYARRKEVFIDSTRHTIIASAHPSPLSARRGFFGSKPFSGINKALEAIGEAPIEWELPSIGRDELFQPELF